MGTRHICGEISQQVHRGECSGEGASGMPHRCPLYMDISLLGLKVVAAHSFNLTAQNSVGSMHIRLTYGLLLSLISQTAKGYSIEEEDTACKKQVACRSVQSDSDQYGGALFCFWHYMEYGTLRHVKTHFRPQRNANIEADPAHRPIKSDGLDSLASLDLVGLGLVTIGGVTVVVLATEVDLLLDGSNGLVVVLLVLEHCE